MTDPVIRPRNGILLIALQSAEGVPATPSAATDAIYFEDGSVTFNSPFTTEQSQEATGSLVAGVPLVIGQPATVGFRSRLKGAGAGVTYTALIKPPLHAALSACGMRGLFTASVAGAALTAGTTSSATLASGFSATAQSYRGMPLLLTGAPAAGRMPLIADYTSGKVATLTDIYGSPLSSSNQGSIPANWTYAGTSPGDLTARGTDHPCATVYWYEDGNLLQWTDCRGTVDFDGNSARAGFAAFSFTGVFQGTTVAALPANPVIASHAGPLLVQGSSAVPAFQVNGRPLAISRWSWTNGGNIESPEDPNTTYGYGSGQIGGRTTVLEADPLKTLASTRNILDEIGSFANYTAALVFGQTAGNRVSLMGPKVQPVEATPGQRESFRSETTRWQALSPGKDASGRDGDRILCFS